MKRTAAIALVAALAACIGNEGDAGTLTPPVEENSAEMTIAEIQGSAAASTMSGQTVTVEGVVSGDFQDNDADTGRNLGGFYVQQPDDDNAETSAGVFVFDGSDPQTAVNPGDLVRITGVVKEHYGETQIVAGVVATTGSGSIEPIDITLPALATTLNSDGDPVADLERYEGMLVRFPQSLSVTELYGIERTGEVLLVEGGRQIKYTNDNPPDVAGFAAQRKDIAARQILLDDGLRTQYATPIRYLPGSTGHDDTIRIGDRVTGVTGVLRFSRGSGAAGRESFRLMPTVEPVFESVNARPGAPVVAGTLRVASYNALNLFSGIDSGPDICGPAGASSCRGADSREELDRQLAKTVTALAMIDADIVGLIELENNESGSLQLVVGALNARLGAEVYSFVATGTIGSDAIKTGFIYKPQSIGLVGPPAILDSTVDVRFDTRRNRPALAQTFEQTSNNARLTIVLNHLKSKGSSCEPFGDPNTGDGQGNCNGKRTAAALAIADWVATDPTGSGDSDFLIIGDLNAYLLEDPLTTIKNAGFTNLVENHSGLAAYSFNYDGESGALDHALASKSLTAQVSGVVEWHINADEPAALDYKLGNGRDPGLFNGAIPYRSSDHDPLIIGLDLSGE